MAKRPVRPEDLLDLIFVSDPQMRPDGQEVLVQRKTIGNRNEYRTQLVGIDLEGQVREWTAPELGARQGRWSPDGRAIAFLGKRGGAETQICRLETGGGEARPITQMPEGDFGELVWSPDSQWIAFTFRELRSEDTAAARKVRESKGLSTPPRIAAHPLYRWDGEGYFLGQRHALYVVEVQTGRVKRIHRGCPWGRYRFSWAPDSNRLAVKRSFQRNLWRDPEDDRILLVDLEGRSTALGGQPRGYKTAVRWSPDGHWIAYLGNPDPLDHRGVGNTELFVAPASGGAPLRLTHALDFDLETGTLSDMGDTGGEFLEWSPDSKRLLLSIGWHGENQLAQIDLKGRLTVLTEGHHCLTPGSLSRDGWHWACLCADPVSPAEPAVFDMKTRQVRKLATFNGAWLDRHRLAPPREIWLKAEDGYPVHAWVMEPARSGKGPKAAVQEIHGGPQAQYGWTFFFEFQVLASAGYAVVFSNPRGSKGYGRDHVAAIAGAWGQKDWLDIAAVKDWMKTQPHFDVKRLGVMGGSYGGYMVNWAVGHTRDFRAAITDRCVSNLLSKSLSSDYPYYPGTYWQGGGYGPLEVNADLWRDSPLAHFGEVRTPMLIIHSEGDLRCGIEQGEQVFATLQERGIPSRFVRYPASTSHGMSRGGPPDLRIHRLNEILRWWRERL